MLVPGEVLHQVQVERQLGVGQALEQCQHPGAVGRVGEVVGVLDAAAAALERDELPMPRRSISADASSNETCV
jgi:hypothetical protein